MNTRILVSIIGIGGLFSSATGSAIAKPVSFTDLPQDAKVSIAMSLRGGQLGEIEEEEYGDQVVYEANINRAGVRQKLWVKQDGTVLPGAPAGGKEKPPGGAQAGANGPGMQGGAQGPGAGAQGGGKGVGAQGGGKGAGVQGGAAAGGLPPGIAKKQGGFLPPGLAKKAARGEQLPPPWRTGTFLPPGLAKKQGPQAAVGGGVAPQQPAAAGNVAQLVPPQKGKKKHDKAAPQPMAPAAGGNPVMLPPPNGKHKPGQPQAGQPQPEPAGKKGKKNNPGNATPGKGHPGHKDYKGPVLPETNGKPATE